MAKDAQTKDALTDLLAIAPAKVLTELILHLVAQSPDTRRVCFDFLKTHVALTDELEKRSEDEVILALWDELDPELSELDEYGGGDYGIANRVGELLHQVCTHLDKKTISSDYRREILDMVLPYIESDNSGMVDSLCDVAYATCYDDEDFTYLAKSLEAMQGDWQIDHARRIYKKLGRREEYLALRQRKMINGADFYDLASFYWESGEKQKALQTAEKGLQKGKGRMDDLRRFLIDRAEETGDRRKYLALQFAQAVDDLTLVKYQAFQELCTPEEWAGYEPQLLARMRQSGRSEQLKLRMHREEYAEALALLKKGRYPIFDGSGYFEIQTAKALEQRYPEEILKFYHTGLGHLNEKNQRTEYARKAVVMAKIQHLLVNVLGDVARWQTFAGKIKRDNFKRPAFQDEFARIVPGWRELK